MRPAPAIRGCVFWLLLACAVLVGPAPARAHGQWLDAVVSLAPERISSREPALLDVRLTDRLSRGPIIGARVTYRARLVDGHARVEAELTETEAARYLGKLRLPADGLWDLVVIVENLDEIVGGSYRVAVDRPGSDVAPLRSLHDQLGWVPDDPVPPRPRWPALAGMVALGVAALWVFRFMRRASVRRAA